MYAESLPNNFESLENSAEKLSVANTIVHCVEAFFTTVCKRDKKNTLWFGYITQLKQLILLFRLRLT